MPLRSFFNWLTGSSPASQPSGPPAGGDVRDRLPSRYGHYAIERKLGEGGMGIVYAARDEKLHRRVALKTMTVLAQDETARQRFWREARAAASVNHPNICQIYEIGEDKGDLFIAMELLEGAPLSDRLKQGPMNVSETASIGLGMLGALAALHSRGIIHRDLKPSNVFLTPHGVKLLDFGLARPAPLGEHDTAPELTRAGVVMGTPHYMSPEQVLGQTRGRALRPVRGRRHPVRDARGPARVRRQLGRRDSARDGIRAAAGAVGVGGRRGGRSRDPPRPRQETGRAARDRRGDGGRAPRRAHWRRRHAGDDARADAPRRAALPDAAPRSRDGFSRVQPGRRDHDVAHRHRLARRAVERDRRAVRRLDAGLQGARRGGGRRSRRHGHAAAIR